MTTRHIPEWLHSAIFYQVYPQSFCDSNSDGIGDLPGLTSKLDYIASLGVTAIWMNPCFVSPFKDAGYDIEDFYHVAPRYGTDEDLLALFREAKARGVRVCLDLVAGHTAATHPWFVESCKPHPNKYSNWYVWSPHWHTKVSPGAWVGGYGERNGQYLANFFYHQPALNYGYYDPDPAKPWQLACDHPDVLALRAEMRNIMRHWLDAGAAGFRVDMAHSLIKDDPEHTGAQAYWHEVRGWLERDYPEAVLIAEWGLPTAAIGAGFHIDLLIQEHTHIYNHLFRMEPESNVVPTLGHSIFHSEGRGDICKFLTEYLDFWGATRGAGYIAITSSNHDLPRLSVGRTAADLAVCFAFLLTQPGMPFIYYGDEIGMRYLAELTSKEGGYNRTGARTPMQWDGTTGAGFSTGPAEQFYLPLDPAPDRPNVAAQDADAGSLLNTVRALAELRRGHPALWANADFTPVHAKAGEYPFVFERRGGGERCLLVFNPAGRAAGVTLPGPGGAWQPLLARGARLAAAGDALELRMEPVSFGIFKAG